MVKFQRNYEITIQNPSGDTLVIRPPFTAKIQVSRSTNSSVNQSTVTLYNLSKNTRNAIYKDRYEIITYWQMIIRAGYGKKLYTIFQGNITQSQSTKQGTDWVTTIKASDGMYAVQNGITSQSIAANTPNVNVLTTVIKDFPNIAAGVFGSIAGGETSRGQVYFGSTSDILDDFTGGNYFIDGEKVNVLTDEEVIASLPVILLDGRQLLQTPQRSETFINVSILFEPSVNIGGFAEVRSSEAVYNGQYKIMGIDHNITISESVAGAAETSLSLYAGAQALQGV